MPTFAKCPKEVYKLTEVILAEFETHSPVLTAKVKIDLVFAFPDLDDEGHPKNVALKKNGVRALGITKAICLKDRAQGRGDAEVTLDGDWWKDASEEEQRALLDHELHHILVCCNSKGTVLTDDLDRPKVKMRKHDYEFGWFKVIAERHGKHSIECQQAELIFDRAGQSFWPQLAPKLKEKN
jgi:hypothetical protein